jgi:hypothetical protein
VVTLRVTDRDGLADTDTATLDVIGSDGYLLVEADGEVTAFGDARLVLRAIDSKAVEAVPQGATRSSALVPHMGGARAVAIETTPAGDGFWVLLDDGRLPGGRPGRASGPGLPSAQARRGRLDAVGPAQRRRLGLHLGRADHPPARPPAGRRPT